jgi:hypothetical protein
MLTQNSHRNKTVKLSSCTLCVYNFKLRVYNFTLCVYRLIEILSCMYDSKHRVRARPTRTRERNRLHEYRTCISWMDEPGTIVRLHDHRRSKFARGHFGHVRFGKVGPTTSAPLWIQDAPICGVQDRKVHYYFYF